MAQHSGGAVLLFVGSLWAMTGFALYRFFTGFSTLDQAMSSITGNPLTVLVLLMASLAATGYLVQRAR